MTTSKENQASGTEAQFEWAPGDPLQPPEQALLDHGLRGKRLDLVRSGRVDHQAMTQWGPSHTVRTAMLRNLLVESQWQVHSKGVRLRGARIVGPLDLESATVRCSLELEDCFFDGPDPVVLAHATVPRIVLSDCRVVGGLTADLLVVTKELDLSGSAFEGVVQLRGAEITGRLACSGVQLTAADSDGNALVGSGMKVGGVVFLDHGFTAAGAIQLSDAEMTGLACSGAQLTAADSDGNALVCSRMKVGGDVTLDRGFTAAGALSVTAARIDGSVSFVGAKLAKTGCSPG
jgi:hypothetical protein